MPELEAPMSPTNLRLLCLILYLRNFSQIIPTRVATCRRVPQGAGIQHDCAGAPVVGLKVPVPLQSGGGVWGKRGLEGFEGFWGREELGCACSQHGSLMYEFRGSRGFPCMCPKIPHSAPTRHNPAVLSFCQEGATCKASCAPGSARGLWRLTLNPKPETLSRKP